MARIEPGFEHLDGAGQMAARLSSTPKTLVYPAMGAAVLTSWAMLLALAGRAAKAPGEGMPGDGLLSVLPAMPLPILLERLLDLCLAPSGPATAGFPTFLALSAMWFLMSIAMMLPSAAPMIRTYCELADTAARQRQSAVHPLVLVCGYLAAWLGASVLLGVISVGTQWLDGTSSPETRHRVAATMLAIAGAYQFSRFREACLTKCRHPFATLFSRWATRPVQIFRLGLEQGLWCLGCCWALMLVMFVVGLMNVFWMALLGLFALAEKQLAGALASRVAGAILLVWSAALLVLSF